MENLTDSELKVLKLIVEGRDNEEIGEALFCAKDTVRGHMKSLYRKFDLEGNSIKKRAKLLLKAIDFFKERLE